MKRFYENVTVEGHKGGFSVHLDGRPVRTPAKAVLAAPSADLAAAIAQEWRAQSEELQPDTMPLTRLSSTASDQVAGRREAVIDEIVDYGGSDHLCYRAGLPADFVKRQNEAWQPLLDWAAATLDAPLRVTTGIVPIDQDAAALAALRRAVAAHDDWRLTALHGLTTVTGSLVLALALERGRVNADEAWELSRLDESHQAERWGEDPEATARAARLRADFDAAVRLLDALVSTAAEDPPGDA